MPHMHVPTPCVWSASVSSKLAIPAQGWRQDVPRRHRNFYSACGWGLTACLWKAMPPTWWTLLCSMPQGGQIQWLVDSPRPFQNTARTEECSVERRSNQVTWTDNQRRQQNIGVERAVTSLLQKDPMRNWKGSTSHCLVRANLWCVTKTTREPWHNTCKSKPQFLSGTRACTYRRQQNRYSP